MKPITKAKISSKLVPDSSHLSALDLHSRGGRLSALVQVTKTGSVQQEVNHLFNFSPNLVHRVQQLKITSHKSHKELVEGEEKKKLKKKKSLFPFG